MRTLGTVEQRTGNGELLFAKTRRTRRRVGHIQRRLGIGYYEGQDVRLIKDAGPVGNSDWVRFIGNQELRSMLIVAHARGATRGNDPTKTLSRSSASSRAGFIYLRTTAIFLAFFNRPASDPIGSIRSEIRTPSARSAFCSTGWHRSGRKRVPCRR